MSKEGWSCKIMMNIGQHQNGPLDYVTNTTTYSSVTLRKTTIQKHCMQEYIRKSGMTMRSSILLQASKCRSQIIVGLVRKMGHQLVHFETFLWRVLIAHLKGFITCCSVVQ